MRCIICDRIIQHPIWNSSTKEYEPCSACLSEILGSVPDEEPREEGVISLEDIRRAEENYKKLK